jgi:hypothetical protein
MSTFVISNVFIASLGIIVVKKKREIDCKESTLEADAYGN